ncbi:hypothetical protein [Pantanalinema sp. GBBB05]|uniref:hypothetical protein n=1 Tax=Pantanalinema sp. GBBB05 TaxID=2604139 RepID=UPI003D81390E
MDEGTFTWSLYVKDDVQRGSVGDWIRRFEADYFTRRDRNPKSQTTWRHDYLKVFSQLPPDESLTIQLLMEAIASTKPDTRTRKRFVDVCTRLADFAELNANFRHLRGNYSSAKVTPRDLPDDRLIAEYWLKIPNPSWQRVYGLIATYGLRPHEVFKSNFARFPVLQIENSTKTGSREVYPFYPEWAESWQLLGELPAVTGATNSDLGNRVTHAFSRYAIPFNAYDLRHRWAVRTLEFGLDVSLSAQQMGHSVRIHCETYHQWIGRGVHQRAFEAILERSDRPMAPLS